MKAGAASGIFVGDDADPESIPAAVFAVSASAWEGEAVRTVPLDPPP
ncbi:hypothetical protein ACFPM0_25500 [Pseudonocardia sulfidoxydans]